MGRLAVRAKAIVVIGVIGVAQARSPAVALVVVRRGADAQEIGFVIPGELSVPQEWKLRAKA
jgi:hypothetical protein